MKPDCVDKIVRDKILSLFHKERIVCLLRYGPIKQTNNKPPSDFDYLLLLDNYQCGDYQLISSIKPLNLPVEIFVDYHRHILQKDISNYQRGCHGSYFIKILGSAHTVYGKNFFTKYINKIDTKKIKSDLCFRIEEYFYRIQKEIINNPIPDKNKINKYIGRIVTDILLLSENLNFSDVNKFHYSEVLFTIRTFQIFRHSKVHLLLQQFHTYSNLNLLTVGKIINILYKIYFETRNKFKI